MVYNYLPYLVLPLIPDIVWQKLVSLSTGDAMNDMVKKGDKGYGIYCFVRPWCLVSGAWYLVPGDWCLF
jgi:hypothetical protein